MVFTMWNFTDILAVTPNNYSFNVKEINAIFLNKIVFLKQKYDLLQFHLFSLIHESTLILIENGVFIFN
jgi:hypothetical protein